MSISSIAHSVYVYGLASRLRPGVIRYVGISSDPVDRTLSHFREAASGHRCHKCNWIRRQGYAVGFLLLEREASYRDAFLAERVYIATLRCLDEVREQFHIDAGCCYNKNRRADRPPDRTGIPRSDETRRKLRAALLGREITPEMRLKIRAALVGRKASQDVRERISAGSKAMWAHRSEEQRANVVAKLRKSWDSEERRAVASACSRATWKDEAIAARRKAGQERAGKRFKPGQAVPEEVKAIISATQRRRFSKPGAGVRHGEILKAAWTPERRARHPRVMAAVAASISDGRKAELRAKVSASITEWWKERRTCSTTE